MPQMSRRRTLLAAPALLLPALASGQARAQQDYPVRPVSMVVPFPPGGGTDTLGRMAAQALTPRLGQPVVVDNRGGAGGNIGSALVAHAAPDGYTILFNGNGMSIADLLFKNPGYDWKRDFAWVARTASTPILLVVNETVPVKTLAEFIAYAKANPTTLNHGTAGSGTPFHLAGELFNSMTGSRITHVPYRGTGPSVAGLLGNEVQVMFASSTAVDGLIREGKVRALASTAPQRARGWPDLPAIAEALPGYAAELWYSVAAPAGTPAPVVARLDQAIRAMMEDQEFDAAITKRGFDPAYLDSAATVAALAAERALWTPIIERAGIRAE